MIFRIYFSWQWRLADLNCEFMYEYFTAHNTVNSVLGTRFYFSFQSFTKKFQCVNTYYYNDTTMELLARARNCGCTSIVIVECWSLFFLVFSSIFRSKHSVLLLLLFWDRIIFLPKKEWERLTIACERILPQNEWGEVINDHWLHGCLFFSCVCECVFFDQIFFKLSP